MKKHPPKEMSLGGFLMFCTENRNVGTPNVFKGNALKVRSFCDFGIRFNTLFKLFGVERKEFARILKWQQISKSSHFLQSTDLYEFSAFCSLCAVLLFCAKLFAGLLKNGVCFMP